MACKRSGVRVSLAPPDRSYSNPRPHTGQTRWVSGFRWKALRFVRGVFVYLPKIGEIDLGSTSKVETLVKVFSWPIDVTLKQLVDNEVEAFKKDPAHAIGELGFSAIFTLITAGAGSTALSAKTAASLKEVKALEKAAQNGVKLDRAAEEEVAALEALERRSGKAVESRGGNLVEGPDGKSLTPDEIRKLPPEERAAWRGYDIGNGRDTYGHFAGFDSVSAAKEEAGLLQYQMKYEREVLDKKVLVKSDATGPQGRFYDGLAQKVDGTYEGIEVKSGSAAKDYYSSNNTQRAFDDQISPNNPAIGKLPDGTVIRITSVRVVPMD